MLGKVFGSVMVALGVTGGAGGVAFAAVHPPSPAAARASGTSRLSNEWTVTRWVNVATLAPVRARPDAHASAVAQLHALTEDGLPEVYVTLRSAPGADGRMWVQVRLPSRPNGRTGWVPRSVLGPYHTVRTVLTIDTGRLRATLLRRGVPIWSTRVGVGAAATPTPRGRFYVRELLRSGDPFYGPWAFGTSAYSSLSDWPGGGVVGIHGTNAPALIPGRPSHGCIRLTNAAVTRLVGLMPIGTPVRIS